MDNMYWSIMLLAPFVEVCFCTKTAFTKLLLYCPMSICEVSQPTKIKCRIIGPIHGTEEIIHTLPTYEHINTHFTRRWRLMKRIIQPIVAKCITHLFLLATSVQVFIAQHRIFLQEKTYYSTRLNSGDSSLIFCTFYKLLQFIFQ